MARSKKPFVLAIGVIVVAAAIVALAWGHGPLGQFVFGNGTRGNEGIRVSGNIEVTDAELGFKIAGRVDSRTVDEGDVVKRGQLIAILETADLEGEVKLRRAERDAAQAVLQELKNGSRPEEKEAARAAKDKARFYAEELIAGSRPQQINAARAEYESAKAEAQRLERELGRSAEMFRRNVTAEESHQRAEAAFDVASRRLRSASEQLSLLEEGTRQQQIDQAKAALEQAKANYDLVMAGPRSEVIEQAQSRLDQANAAVELTETRLGYARLTSPMDGVVLSKNIEPGEFVGAGTPVVTVGDLVNVWLRAYIDGPDLGRVKLGQKARVTTDSTGGKIYEGVVGFIAQKAEFTPKNVQTEKERAKLVYRVKIFIKNDAMELKPGMPADAEILVNP